MKVRKQIAIVHNLTGGGAVRVLKETTRILSRYYIVKTFTPEKYNDKGKKGIQKIFSYLKYIYFILPQSYRKISAQINNDNFVATILHHDSYTKAPAALLYLKNRSVYILHEPPREFHEPLKFHAPLISDKLVTLLRIPLLFLDKIVTRRATRVVANSMFSKRRIDSIYGIKSKLIYCGASKKFHLLKNHIRLRTCISVGSLLPFKGHDLSISAIGRMDNKPNLLIIGKGRKSEKEKLLNLAQKNKVKVKIVETVSDEKLNSLYNKSVYVNSGYKEPFGLSALESLAAGSQVVTVNDCGTRELKKYFPEKVIIVFRNPRAISVGINKAFSNRIYKKEKIPKIFKWENNANEIRKIIEDKSFHH